MLLNVKIPVKLKEDLIAYAEREKTYVSDIVRRAIINYIYTQPEQTTQWRIKRVTLR